jgi:aldehyde dehydrogenase (NAD+)
VGKHQNAGQICLAPDHVWVHRDVRDEFVKKYLAAVENRYYIDGALAAERLGKLVDRRNFDRVSGYLDDAVARGAEVISVGDSDPQRRILAPTVLLNVPTDADIMRREIFGPILPVLDFTEMSTVTSWLQDNDKPLAMYVFGRDRQAIENILAATSSGGVSINGWALHFADSRLPFGGIGGSGMGRYHGVHGFRELSHARSVVSVGTAE